MNVKAAGRHGRQPRTHHASRRRWTAACRRARSGTCSTRRRWSLVRRGVYADGRGLERPRRVRRPAPPADPRAPSARCAELGGEPRLVGSRARAGDPRPARPARAHHSPGHDGRLDQVRREAPPGAVQRRPGRRGERAAGPRHGQDGRRHRTRARHAVRRDRLRLGHATRRDPSSAGGGRGAHALLAVRRDGREPPSPSQTRAPRASLETLGRLLVARARRSATSRRSSRSARRRTRRLGRHPGRLPHLRVRRQGEVPARRAGRPGGPRGRPRWCGPRRSASACCTGRGSAPRRSSSRTTGTPTGATVLRRMRERVRRHRGAVRHGAPRAPRPQRPRAPAARLAVVVAPEPARPHRVTHRSVSFHGVRTLQKLTER